MKTSTNGGTVTGTQPTDGKKSRTQSAGSESSGIDYVCYKLISDGEGSLCRTRFANFEDFIKHQHERHSDENIADIFVCDCCEDYFHDSESWRAHLVSRFDPSTTSTCRSLMLKLNNIWDQHDKYNRRVMTVPEANTLLRQMAIRRQTVATSGPIGPNHSKGSEAPTPGGELRQ